MDAVASIREANGPKGLAQERQLIQVPPNWIPACAGMTNEWTFDAKRHIYRKNSG